MLVRVIGTPIQTQGMSWTINTDVPGQLDIQVYAIWSGTACRQWEMEQEPEGIVRITCRQVLPSPISNSGDYRAVLSTEGVNAVYLGDQLIWQGGVEISPQIDRIYQAQTPYVGTPPPWAGYSTPYSSTPAAAIRWSCTPPPHLTA